MKMNDYIFTLPFPPSSNSMYRRSGNHIHLSEKGRDYKKSVLACLGDLAGELIESRLKVKIEVSAPNRRKYDIDNRIKGLLDALQDAGLFVDDEQIDDLRIKRLPIDEKKQGFAVVTINSIGE